MEKYNNINIINIDAMYYCANENNVKELLDLINNQQIFHSC
jgi:dTDP-D-glucose 4,6-dehydratase